MPLRSSSFLKRRRAAPRCSRSWTRIRSGMLSPETVSAGLIQAPDLRGGLEDVPVPVCHYEVTVGNPGRGGVDADEDVYPVGILPQRPDLHLQQVARLAEGVEHLFPDEGVQRLPLVPLPVLG